MAVRAKRSKSEPKGTAQPVMLGAIDAGSNAIRLVIAHAANPYHLHRFESERCAIRLGHNVFTHGSLTDETIDQAAQVFRHFAALFERYGVRHYRAVATSATREAKNKKKLIDRLERESGIRLEVIDGIEEARLVVQGVRRRLGRAMDRGLVLDLGGGSLELMSVANGSIESVVTAPLGTVRLMESFKVNRAMRPRDIERVRSHVLDVLQTHLPALSSRSFPMVAGCGGNAETLARIAPGTPRFENATLSLKALERLLGRLLAMDVATRMEEYGVRRDRAEVMGVAALTLVTLGKLLGMNEIVVPAVGVREGILSDLLAGCFPAPHDTHEQEDLLLLAARGFAASMHHPLEHGEQVCTLALSLFDQLEEAKALGAEARSILAAAALLHDVGHVIGRTHHHAAGAHMLHDAHLPYLDVTGRRMVETLVRCHGRTSPDAYLETWSKFTKSQRQCVRLLVGILRCADGLDADRRQAVESVRLRRRKAECHLEIVAGRGAELAEWGVRRKIGLLEKELGYRIRVPHGTELHGARRRGKSK